MTAQDGVRAAPADRRFGRRIGALAPALRWRPDSNKFRLLAGTLLTLSAAYGVAFLAISIERGWPQGFGDSFALWSWGRFAAEHPAAAIYDPAALRAGQLALGLDPGASYPFAYPPSFLLVLWPLGQVPGWLAWAMLAGLTLPLYLWATVGRDWRAPAVAAALAAPTTAITLVSGQSGFLAAGLMAGGLRLAGSQPVAAGVLFGLLSYKPQLGLLVPVALAAARLWRSFAAAAATGAALVILTTLLFGVAIWPSWAAALPGFARQFAAENSEIVHFMPTVFAALSQLRFAPDVAQAAQWASAAAAAVVVWLMFRRGPSALAGAGLLVAALLATPYAFVYDMPIVATAVLWVVADERRRGPAFTAAEVAILILTLAAPVTLPPGVTKFPLVMLSLILFVGMTARRCRRLLLLPQAATTGGAAELVRSPV
jgi:hypothetical protein